MDYLLGINGAPIKNPVPVANAAVKNGKRAYSDSLKNTDTFSHFCADSLSVSSTGGSQCRSHQPINFTLPKGLVNVGGKVISLKDYPARKDEAI